MPGKSGLPGNQVAGKLAMFLGNLREKMRKKKEKKRGKWGRRGKKEKEMWKHDKERNGKDEKERNGTNYEYYDVYINLALVALIVCNVFYNKKNKGTT